MAYPLPADIPIQHIQPTKIDNFTLLLQRFVDEEVAQGGRDRGPRGRDRGPTEYQAYTEILTCFNQIPAD